MGIFSSAFAEPDLFQAPVDDLRDLLVALLGVLAQRERDVVVEVQRAEQGTVLEQHAELLAQLEQVGVGQAGDRVPVHDHVALVGIEQADDVLDADRLARARGAEDHRDLVLGQGHVQAAQHLVAPERLVDVDELDRVGLVGRADRAGVVVELVPPAPARALAQLRAVSPAPAVGELGVRTSSSTAREVGSPPGPCSGRRSIVL